MQFSDLTKAIHDAWTFSWPPIIVCVIFIWVSRYLNPKGTHQMIKALAEKVKINRAQVESVRLLLEPYGLTKLIPVVSAVALIGFLYVVNGPLLQIASKLPPHISYQPDVLIYKSISQEEKLVLLRKYPAAESFNSAYYMALRGRKTGNSVATPNRAEFNYKVELFIKFAFLSAMALVVMNVKHGLPFWSQLLKVVFMAALVSPIWFVNFVSLLRNQENQFYDEWAAVRIELLAHSQTLLEKNESVREKDILEQLTRNHGRR
jgi:hypothetical protein